MSQTRGHKPSKIQQPGLQTRWFAARAWLVDRLQDKDLSPRYMSLFAYHYPELADQADVIAEMWRGRLRVSTEHLPILTKVEAIIETIKNQPNAA